MDMFLIVVHGVDIAIFTEKCVVFFAIQLSFSTESS